MILGNMEVRLVLYMVYLHQDGWKDLISLRLVQKLFLKNVEHQLCNGPVILFVDGHHSQNWSMLQGNTMFISCVFHQILHNPLDVSAFHPLKQAYFKILKKYKTNTLAANISKAVIPTLVNMLWDVSFKSSHLCSGFKATGIHPLNQEII